MGDAALSLDKGINRFNRLQKRRVAIGNNKLELFAQQPAAFEICNKASPGGCIFHIGQLKRKDLFFALSFIGLGLKDPVNSLGVMLQNVTSADVLLNYQWYFIPVIFFIALVLAFVFVGDGLRDAADPYSSTKK